MITWSVEYWSTNQDGTSSAEELLDELTDAQFKSVAKELKLLGMCGNQLRLPHSKPLGDGLFELRERNFGYRIYYAFCRNKVIVLLHAGDKSAQDQDIKIARRRLTILLAEIKYEN